MRRKGKLLLIFAALIAVTALVLSGCSGSSDPKGENLIANGDFSQAESSTKAEGWYGDAYNASKASGAFSYVMEGEDGSRCAKIVLDEKNDARFVQKVGVNGNTLYKLTARVKTENVAGGKTGANLSVMDIFTASRSLSGTQGWQTIEFYGRTAATQTSLEIGLRLGFYSSECTGTVWFDDITMVQVDSAPDGITVASFAKELNNNSNKPTNTDETAKTGQIVAIGLLAAFMGLVMFYLVRRDFFRSICNANGVVWFIVVCFVSAVLHFYYAYTVPGFSVDINCFGAWGNRMLSKGLDFYGNGFCDYPPLYMFVLAIPALINKALGLTFSTGFGLVMLKLPAMVCDFILGAFIYRVAGKKLGSKIGMLLSAFWLLNPAVIVNSASWGQIDAVFTLLLVLALYYIIKRKMGASVLWYLAALLCKVQALLFAPVMLAGAIRCCMYYVRDRKSADAEIKKQAGSQLWRFAASLGVSLAVFVLLSVLMQSGQPRITWLFEKYFATMSSYPYAALSTFNLMSLLGGQWAQLGTEVMGLGITYQTLHYILLFASIAAAVALMVMKFKNRCVYLWASFIVAAIVTLTGTMHERYLYPVLGLLIMAYVVHQDKCLLYCLGGFSVLHYANVALVLYLHNEPAKYFAANDAVLLVGSALQVLMFAYFAYVCFSIVRKGEVEDELIPEKTGAQEDSRVLAMMQEERRQAELRKAAPKQRSFTGRDWLIMLSVTVIYAAISLVNLGSTNTPESYWEVQTRGEWVMADFGEVTDVQRIYYNNSINEGTFYVEYSVDGQSWERIKSISYKNGSMYVWRPVQDLDVNNPEANTVQARYMRISAQNKGMRFNEIVFFSSQEAQSAIPIVNVTGSGDPNAEHGYACLFDEQQTAVTRPTYMTGMYFDEIYHARTAYEHINGWQVYEITHPPLGKVIMSWGIELFGMNPFGWRFMGNLMGILMLPAMYVFGKLLFKKTSWASALMLLMALDGMHFVQTRIATIDSYAVFFIICMYACMYKYYTMNYCTQSYVRTFVPLALSGVFFGLGAASKWIGIYAGVGLAVIYFFAMFRRFREYGIARRVAEGSLQVSSQAEKEHFLRVKARFWPGTLASVCVCVVFFVIVPLTIYCLSYIPYFNAPGNKGNWLDTILSNQEYMLNYHSGLTGDTHYFRSSFYEWPLMWRPMWFYQAPELSGTAMGTISCCGNPLIWWAGMICTVASVVLLLKKAIRYRREENPEAMLAQRKELLMLLFVFIGLGANYLAWVLVPRSTFIYHYFASLPFIMIFTVYVFRLLYNRLGRKGRNMIVAFFVICAVLSVMFYPVWSGVETSKDYVGTFLKWLPRWHFFNN